MTSPYALSPNKSQYFAKLYILRSELGCHSGFSLLSPYGLQQQMLRHALSCAFPGEGEQALPTTLLKPPAVTSGGAGTTR